MTPDELWEKHKDDLMFSNHLEVSNAAFLAALAEYGAAVRQRDAEIASDSAIGSVIADTISKEPLP